MANTIRIKRRAAGGAAGAPVSLANGELAYNEQDNILYYGVGTGGAGGSATSIIGIGGSGAYAKTDGSNATGTWDVDTTGNAATATNVAWSGVTGTPTTRAGYGITDAQALDADLTAIAALAGTSGLLRKTAANTWSLDTTAYLEDSADVVAALGYTPENAANKGVANGYASLDGSGKVPSAQLPSFVDDVQEFANLAAFPATGDSGVIYVAIDTGKTYRWGGSAYAEISASPGSTDAVPEGATNLYYTDTRARGAVSASGSLSYNSGTGVFSYTEAVSSVAGKTGVVTLVKADVGLGNVENTALSTWTGSTSLTTLGTVATGTWNATAITAAKGGTGQTTYTIGDILYASSASALSKLAGVATGSALISGGVGAAPSWGKVGLTTHISGTLAAGNGGTGQSSYTVGDILYASTTSALSKLAGVAAGNVLLSGGVGTAPSWGKVALTTHVSGTLPVANGGSGATTLTGYLKGNGTSAFTGSASIPVGDLSGTLSVASGGTGATTLTGYVKGAGTAALTASATIPNTDITGLGTMSTQNANNVAITGGTIDGITLDGGTF